MAAAVMPIFAPAITLWLEWDMALVILTTMTAIIVAAGIVGLLLVRLTTRLVREQERFDEERRHWREEAHTDPLSGVANRRGAAHEVELRQLAAGPDDRWSVMALDIDSFKQVNDRHGHPVGDRVLVAVADVLADHLPAGAVVARWGGDEFVVFELGATDHIEEWAGGIAEAIAAHPIPCREGDLHVSVSFGVAHGPADGRFDDVLAAADDALLRAKESVHAPIDLGGRELGRERGRQFESSGSVS
ncbi:MAG: GGDEF domain-containing protein [Acidimicrobiales bacterium]